MFAIIESQTCFGLSGLGFCNKKRGRGRQDTWDIPFSLFVFSIKYHNTMFPSAVETGHLVLSVAPMNGDGESSVFQTLLISDTL